MEHPTQKIPVGVKAGYGVAEGANSVVFTLFYTFGMFFYTDVVKLDPAFAGTMLAVGTLWNAFMDPAVGVLSDNLESPWGRRRPFLLGIALPFGAIAWLLFSDFGLGDSLTKVYFFSAVLLYFTVYSFLEVPHLSLSAEMTQDYDERTSLVGWRIGWSQVGSVIGGVAPLMLVAAYAGVFGSQKTGWSLMGATFGLICVPMILVTWRATRGYELFPENTSVRLRDMITGPLQNRPFRYVVALYTIGLVGMTIGGSVGVYFMTYIMGFSENQIAFALFIGFGVAIAWIPVIDFLSSRFGKRAAWMIMIGQWALVMGVGFQFLLQPGQAVFFYVLAFFLGGGLASVYMIGWAMIPDCVEVDEFKTGMRREGLYFGVIAFAQKGACAIALWVVGLALSWIGYVPEAEQSEAALQGIRTINGGVETTFLVVSILLCYAMPMTREKHQALCEALALKKQGEPYDQEPFEDLL